MLQGKDSKLQSQVQSSAAGSTQNDESSVSGSACDSMTTLSEK